MRIGEVAKLAGVTVRTLRHYDQIGLLKPSAVTEAGYRLYDVSDLETLQQILFFRELGFALEDIRRMMQSPAYDKEEALRRHRELLLRKRDRIDRLIDLVDRTLKGNVDMDYQLFEKDGIEELKGRYAAEARERWGATPVYAEYEAKQAAQDDVARKTAVDEMEVLLAEFGRIRNLSPDSPQAQELVARWQAHITTYYYTCTKEILAGLGQMYAADGRFRQNMDRHGEETAEFVARAIEAYTR